MAIDWVVIGTALGGIATGIGGFIAGRGKRKAADAMSGAEAELYKTLRAEIAALHDEIVRLRRYVGRLERALRDGGLELPLLDDDYKAGGTSVD